MENQCSVGKDRCKYTSCNEQRCVQILTRNLKLENTIGNYMTIIHLSNISKHKKKLTAKKHYHKMVKTALTNMRIAAA